ncbi:MAG TPA: DEAD/DEAH box helicase [Polyangiaceae bacterium]|nr:DEAD/DEAH box helicase [Polyangiaceae bacterium]
MTQTSAHIPAGSAKTGASPAPAAANATSAGGSTSTGPASSSPQSGFTRPEIGSFQVKLRLYTEHMTVTSADGSEREQEVPVVALTFDYSGTEIHASDRRDRFFVAAKGGVSLVERDRAGEARAQCLLESFGAVEVSCAEAYCPPLDSTADYLVHPDGNVHAWCSFTAYAVPQLRALGWQVSIPLGYPYKVVSEDAQWYAGLMPGELGESDWFSLELGVEINGSRVDLLPAMMELLDECSDTEALEALLRMPTRFRVLPVGEGQYLPVPPERLRSLVRVILELYRGERLESGNLVIPSSRTTCVSDLDAAFASTGSELVWRGDRAAYEKGRSLSGSPHAAPPVAHGLQAGLRPYQAEGVAWLQHLRAHDVGGILADDMGLGKTLQTIAHLVIESESGRMDVPSLIVVPKSLLGNWQRELTRFAPKLRLCIIAGSRRAEQMKRIKDSDVVITTYPILVRDIDEFSELPFHYLILDEAQAIKNPRSLSAGAVKALNARHRLCLSGTPVENHLGELWALFDFLMPGFLGDKDRFRSKYRTPIERDGNESVLTSLRHVVSPFILRRMKEHVASELPPKTEIVRPVELEGDQRELYESIRVAAHGEVRNLIRKKGILGSTVLILDALMKLRQVCCDPRLVGSHAARDVKTSAKHQLFFELLELQLSQGRRILVFSQFTRMLALLGKGLEERGIPYVELTGDTADRQQRVDRFQAGEVDVFLISLKAGGTGLNLTRADTVIHYDPWWNAAAQAQATDRAYRIGQTEPVFVYELIVSGSVEERMLRLKQKKAELSKGLLGNGGLSEALSEDDVDDLFSPLGD